MNFSQAYNIGKVINNAFSSFKIESLIYELIAKLSSLTKTLSEARNNFSSQNLASPNITNSLAKIEPLLITIQKTLPALQAEVVGNLTIDEIDILDVNISEINELIGKIKNANINNIILIYEQLLSSINELYNAFSRLQQFSHFFNSTKPLEISDIEEDSDIKKSTLSIIFEDDALITKLNEISAASKEWNFIINCFARLVCETDTDVEISSIKRGSLIVTVFVASTIIGALCRCSNKVLETFLRFLNAKQKVLELQKTGIMTELEIAKLLKKTDINVNEQAQEITEELMEYYFPNTEHTDYHEIKTAVLMAVKNIIKFEGKGGRIDAKILEKNEDYKQAILNLRERNTQFKLQRNNVAALTEGRSFLQLEESTDKDGEDDESTQ
ncbi:hypothetical protein SAMN05428975_0765 [Mucilaginibacter sp. OK268]|uniref:hypothetical protein n=1 Tax=Mucilaginibacter sp. OK268 TaxID=1881048 RepID=UPI00088ABC28|nr:hypothetical protein [Mucilaginibacter sp. OK268]SDP22350.1 hypothetical protein SAMN05428975_0765 [Mucilaginibacter sp. OK268]